MKYILLLTIKNSNDIHITFGNLAHIEAGLKCTQNNDNRELLSFALTAVNILNKLTAIEAKLNSPLSSLF